MDRIDLFKAFFTEESKYYADKLAKYENDKKNSFNFWAGFFGMSWFIYRRMNIQAVLVFILTLVLSIIALVILSIVNPFGTSNLIYCILAVFVLKFVMLGFVSNIIYLNKSKKIVDKFIDEFGLENIDSSIVHKIRLKGGTALISALIFQGIVIVLNIIIRLAH